MLARRYSLLRTAPPPRSALVVIRRGGVTMAQKHLPANRVDNLVRILWSLETDQQVSNLTGATRV